MPAAPHAGFFMASREKVPARQLLEFVAFAERILY